MYFLQYLSFGWSLQVLTIKKFNKDFQSYSAVQHNGNPNIDEIFEKLASEFVRQENKYCTPQTLS